MKEFRFVLPLLLSASLAACGGSDASSEASAPAASVPKVSVDALPAGGYVVAIGNADAPTIGQYYSGSDGSRLLIVNDGDDVARAVYKQNAGGVWRAVPEAKADVDIRLLGQEARTSPAVDAAQRAGRYTVVLATGAATFSLSAQGAITADGSGCRISGQTGTSPLPGAQELTLAFAGCDGLPASATGVLLTDPDYAPAILRLVVDDGSKVVDLWAYPA
ncbi:hypothetical protein [Jeongeupia naejangsanensis]|uniref:Lipoprotein n=1 Tax=Jeongeupia naejangsanensis TaxID=613195 RepID=A0ABS2BME0_9NEIS|nr:hypothetical protein [Jeongeupia naejangsanensis]MBM3116166.1 hypothetical protein [Jeongeupia naejangsanensis]